MKFFRLPAFLLILFLTLFALFLFNPANASGKKKIGFIPMTMNNEYFVIMVNAAKAEAEKRQAQLIIQSGDSHRSGNEQSDIIEQMLALKVEAICIVPSSNSVIRKLQKVQAIGMPIVNVDTKIDPALIKRAGLKPIPFVGTNNFDGARTGGEYALKNLGVEGKNVGILMGIPQQKNAVDRLNGFKQAISGKARVLIERPANWEKDTAYQAFKTILKNNPDLNFLFACNDNMAMGAIDAALEADREDIKVLGYDGTNSALNFIEKGYMAATVAQMPAQMGIQAVRTAIEMLEGKKVPLVAFTQTKIIDKSNVSEFKAYLKQYHKDH